MRLIKISSQSIFKISAVLILLFCILFVSYSYQSGGIIYIFLRSDISVSDKIDYIKEYFNSFGIYAPLIYFFIVVIEVIVAPIPGSLLYAPGGIIWGGFIGGLISLLGNVVGAGIAYEISKIVGRGYIERFFQKESLEKIERILENRGALIIFLLRVNPLTSSDIVSYASGLTRMKLWQILLGTFGGMLPICFLQSYLANEMFTAFPILLYPFFILCLGYAGLIIILLWKWKKSPFIKSNPGIPGTIKETEIVK